MSGGESAPLCRVPGVVDVVARVELFAWCGLWLGIWAGDFGGPGSAVALGGYCFDAGVND